MRDKYYEAVAQAKNGNWAEFSDLLDQFPRIVLFFDEMGAGMVIELSGVSGAASYIERIISLGADPNIRTDEGETAIGRSIAMDTVLNPTIENITSLLRMGADPDGITTSGNTPLVFALEMNKLNHACRLIEFGADLDKKTIDFFPMSAADLIRSRRILGLPQGRKAQS